MTRDPILAADEAEERAAAEALRATTTTHELVTVWARDCDRFEGEARERLQDVYADCLRQFAPAGAAG
jgi:hypothetical protein